jgi:hypothetical protein
MLLLNVVDFAPPTHQFNNSAAKALVRSIRQGMPDLNAYGLNRAWAMCQGWVDNKVVETTCQTCGNRIAPGATAIRGHHPECQRSYKHRRVWDKSWTPTCDNPLCGTALYTPGVGRIGGFCRLCWRYQDCHDGNMWPANVTKWAPSLLPRAS